jgi:ribosomal-protein-serine acetyltransferase
VTVILHALLLDIPDVVETGRLRLQATRAGMGEAINAAIVESLADIARWMPWAKEPQQPEDSERHCREMQAKWHAREELDFCMLRRADGELVGKASLHTIDWSLPRFEIGYWVRSSCTGSGYATEATLGLAGMARDSLGARRLEIASDTRNGASRRVAEKSGFVLEGIRRNARRDVEGGIADSCMYARTF